MMTFTCPACREGVSVEAIWAGKTTACPACGRTVPVPALVEATVSLPPTPAAGVEERTEFSRPDGSDALTPSPAAAPDATGGMDDGDAGPSLTDFLAPPQSDDEIGRLGKYRILKVLGHGGMGVVYKAEDPKLRRVVALKAMLPALAASASAGHRFLREAQAMAAVKHDHIATIYQVDEERGIPFLAMEFLAGEPLDERLRREGKLPVDEVLRIGREIAEGLAAAHATGLIHRDIKPANVWLESPRDRVKILDFGLARAASRDAGLTAQGAILGTPAYMAPEQGRGEAVDARCDLFSLGVVLYRLCTGRHPFEGKDAIATLIQVATHQPTPPARLDAGVPRELSDLVMRLLEKDPERRPASAAVVVALLQAVERKLGRHRGEREDTIASAPETPGVPRTKGGRGRKFVLLAVVLLALVPLGWWLAVAVLSKHGPDLPKTAATGSEADRKAAEYVLSVGGAVRVNGEDSDIRLAAELPRGAFRLTGVNLNNKPVGDAGLAHFEGCKNLTELRLRGCDQVSDAGLAHFADSKGLTVLELGGTRVSDAGLAPFKDCKGLTLLDLNSSRIGDAGLAPFKDCKGLRTLLLVQTRVTAKGIDDLKKALPRCRIEWDGGVIQPKPSADADREAAQYILSIGGTVRVNGGEGDIKAAAGLPPGPFRLTAAILNDKPVGDAALARLEGCEDLTILNLWATQVSDAGLAHVERCKKLEWIDLYYTKVGDAGLAHLKDCKRLKVLNLAGTRVSDAGLAPLEGFADLTQLLLMKTQVGDAGLTHIQRLESLTILRLDGTKVGDAGLAHVRGCKKLQSLDLRETKVTAKGIDDLKKALPRCRIEWDGGVIQPKPSADPDREAAEYVLSVGGSVGVAGREGVIKAAADLPREPFRLTHVRMENNKQLTDAGLAHFEGCKHVTYLDLNGTKVGDEGLAHFEGCKNLELLGLSGTGVSDAGLAHFEGCKGLRELGLNDTKVGDDGLRHFAGCKGLTYLNLHATKVTDRGLAHLRGAKGLTGLHLSDTQVGDAGLALFEGCNGLTTLSVQNTKVSDLAPLKRMGLSILSCNGTQVTDLSPLKGMPLKQLACDFHPDRDTGLLLSLTTLETINGKPAKAFWEEVDAKKAAFDAWLKRVAALQPDEQAEAVAAKLKELNPGFDGKVTHKAEGGKVTEFKVVTDRVTDISPLRAFDSLRSLDCSGPQVGYTWDNGRLADLSPLRRMNLKGLTFLRLNGTKVGDAALACFKDSKGLMSLNLNNTPVSDAGLAPFEGCKGLAYLDLGFTRIGDAGMAHFRDCKSLVGLYLGGTRVGDAGLAPFKDCKGLTGLDLKHTKVGDDGLAFFEGCKELAFLDLNETRVGDAGMAHFRGARNLTYLNLDGTRVGDAGLASFENCKGLKFLGLKRTKVTDAGLAYFKDCKGLIQLQLAETEVGDAGLASFRGCKGLTWLGLSGTKVSDLSPLGGMKLTQLYCERTQVTDLSPLKGMPLKVLACDFVPERDAAILRSLKTLETINGKPAKEFWKDVDGKEP